MLLFWKRRQLKIPHVSATYIIVCTTYQSVQVFSPTQNIWDIMLQYYNQVIFFYPDTGRVFVCGSNTEGQLGLGEDTRSSVKFTELKFMEKIAFVECGYYHTVFITGLSLFILFWYCQCSAYCPSLSKTYVLTRPLPTCQRYRPPNE